MFDTHCHLQFESFQGRESQILDDANAVGVTHIMIPSTDVATSQRAVEIASEFNNVYAAVGIHPHHVFQHQASSMKHGAMEGQKPTLDEDLEQIQALLVNKKVLAVGEIGIDRYYYRRTKYSDYEINDEFINLQKQVMATQMQWAVKYKKSLILHNREAVDDFLEVVATNWDKSLESRTVFHCCEPDKRLLEFAKAHNIFWGVDGDITYYSKKQSFITQVPLEMLVLETDSPFLIPEPLKSQGVRPNTPANILLIADFVANLRGEDAGELKKATYDNAMRLFGLA